MSRGIVPPSEAVRQQIKQLLITSDEVPGHIRAVGEMWPKNLRRRCLAHKTGNILDKAPRAAQEEINRRVRDVFTPRHWRWPQSMMRTSLRRMRAPVQARCAA